MNNESKPTNDTAALKKNKKIIEPMFTQLISGNYCLHCYKQHNNNDNEKVNELTVSPQVHVSVKPVAENIGAGTSRATAHNYDNYSLDWKYVENQ